MSSLSEQQVDKAVKAIQYLSSLDVAASPTSKHIVYPQAMVYSQINTLYNNPHTEHNIIFLRFYYVWH